MRGKGAVKAYIKELPKSKTKKEAKQKAKLPDGTPAYADKTHTSTIEASKTFQEFQKTLAEQIKDNDTVKAYKDALKAKKKDTADHYIRLSAAKEVNKLKGQYKQLEGYQANPISGVDFGW